MRPSVLVVDDEPDICELVREVLEGEGYVVRCAADGEAGLVAATAAPPDLVVTDVLMPGLDGYGLIARLRERGLGMPVVVTSAHARSIPDGVVAAFVPKPFAVGRLVAAVAEALPSGAVGTPPTEAFAFTRHVTP